MTQTITHKNETFEIEIKHDDYANPPWQNDDCCGFVSAWRNKNTKRPHERVLCVDHGQACFYDWNASMAKAMKEGWGISRQPDDKRSEFEFNLWRKGLSKKQLAHFAVEQDFQRLKARCDDHWSYVGVVVTHIDSGESISLFGIESGDQTYQDQVALELADELFELIRKKELSPCL